MSILLFTNSQAEFLQQALEGLNRQTVSKKDFEILIVDNVFSDNTKAVVESFSNRLPIHFYYRENKMPAFLENQLVTKLKGDIVVFLNDDVQASPTFLEEHLLTHRNFLEDNYAVLSYTTWAPHLTITPLMEFITLENEGLFCCSAIHPGRILDYLFFWRGGYSCKRKFIRERGGDNPAFLFGKNDVEFLFQLPGFAFKGVCNRKALNYMLRPVGFEDFCLRSILLGRSNFIYSNNHPDPEIQEWCQMDKINQIWSRMRDDYEPLVTYAREMDDLANRLVSLGIPLEDGFKASLFGAYQEAFWACKVKGIMGERGKSSLSFESTKKISYLLDPVKDPFKVVAIICVYNEGDIIYHSIRHLIENGIYVYLLNHNSTDNTVEEAAKWLGKGLLHIELFPQESNIPEKYKQTFALGMITRRVEQLHRELGADWYLHYDTDEFRESPWPEMTLREAIKVVDALGYNAINFELLNFRPVDNSFIPGQDVRKYLKYYEQGEEFNRLQIKAWKNFGQSIDLSAFLGHQPIFKDRKVFPVHFITLHFPIRSQTQGLKKVIEERKNRFDEKEREVGAHIQYDDVGQDHTFIRNKEELTLYLPKKVREKLWLEAIWTEIRNR